MKRFFNERVVNERIPPEAFMTANPLDFTGHLENALSHVV